MCTIVVRLDYFKDLVDLADTQVCGVDQFVHLVKLVPDLLLEDSLRGDGKAVRPDEVGLTFIAEIGIVFQKVFELAFLGGKFSLLVLEHPDGSSSVDDEHLGGVWSTYMHQSILCGCLNQEAYPLWLPLSAASGS